MNQNHDLYLDLVAAFAVGALDPDDRRVLSEHLGTCAECQAFLRDLSAPVESLARSAMPVKPKPGLKARVLVEISKAAGARRTAAPALKPAPVAFLRLVPPWAWGIAAALLLAAGIGWWRASTLSGRVDELERDLEVRRTSPDQELATFVQKYPGARTMEFKATPQATPRLTPGFVARVAYDAAGRRALVVFDWPVVADDLALELWTVRDGKNVSEGILRKRLEGRGRDSGVQVIENTGDPAHLQAFAISEEGPRGSVDRQTPERVAFMARIP